MAADNVTPIYGEWLVKHIDNYKFCGENAQALKKDLISINVNDSESDLLLVECYRRFLSMFVYDIYDTAFEQYAEGIMAMNNKAFLVHNQYGVWAPVGLMEESGKEAELNLDYTNSTVNRKIAEKIIEVELIQKEYQESMKELGMWNKKEKPSKIMTCVTVILCIAIVVCFLLNYKLIPSADFGFPMVIVWGGIALVVFWGMVKVFCEINAIHKWKKLEKLKEWFENFCKQEGENNSFLAEYKRALVALEQNGSEYNLPKPSKSFQEYLLFLDDKSRALQTIIKNHNKLHRKIGKFIVLFLTAALVFIVYGQNHWSIVEVFRNVGVSRSLSESNGMDYEDVQTQPILSSIHPISIVNATASSELTTNGYTFSIINSYDGDVDTCWQDGVAGDGVGEVLVYYFDQPRYIAAMDIINGRVISEEKYYDNNRIESMTVYCFLDGRMTASTVINFDDVYVVEPAHYELTEGVMDEKYYCEGIQIVIESVYVGEKYDDLCLTEIQFFEGIYQ